MFFLPSRTQTSVESSHGQLPCTMAMSPVALIVPTYDVDPVHVPDTVKVKLAVPTSPCVPLALNLADDEGPVSLREESIGPCWRIGLGSLLAESSQSPLESLS
jgi:hypothetical protein